jgi:hypothetical protein
MPGSHRGEEISILDVYDAQAAVAVGSMDESEANEILRTACPGVGGCGIAASFNTWGVAMEAIGLMLPYSSSIPAIDEAKHEECIRRPVRWLHGVLQQGLRPRDILTRRAFENAATAIAAIGGSTNGVLHLLALAREADVEFTLRDMQAIFRRTPVLCSFAPRGKKTMVDMHRIGGTPVLLKHLWRAGLLDGDTMTVVGKTLGQVAAEAADLPEDQQLIAPADAPFKPFADMQICFGNLAPDGIVFKVSSMQQPRFRGVPRCASTTPRTWRTRWNPSGSSRAASSCCVTWGRWLPGCPRCWWRRRPWRSRTGRQSRLDLRHPRVRRLARRHRRALRARGRGRRRHRTGRRRRRNLVRPAGRRSHVARHRRRTRPPPPAVASPAPQIAPRIPAGLRRHRPKPTAAASAASCTRTARDEEEWASS